MEKKKSMQLCDACCEGRLHPMKSNEPVEYKGINGQLIIHYSICDVCKAELSDASDLLKNKHELVRFKKKVDHVPLGSEIVELRRKHNLTQRLAANIFGGGPVAFSKYENDDLIPDESMVNLLKLAIAHPDTVRRLAKLKGIELEDTRSTLKVTDAAVPVICKIQDEDSTGSSKFTPAATFGNSKLGPDSITYGTC